MCRMLACLTTEPLPRGLLREFGRLSHEGLVPPGSAPGHTSGWGAYGSDFGVSSIHYRTSRDAWDDPSYGGVSATLESLGEPRSMMVHLRKASIGKPKTENSHPFVIDGRAFMHNGSVRGLSGSFSATRRPAGQTDSEKLFLILLDQMEERGFDGALSALLHLVEPLDYTSLTFVLQEGASLYAYRRCRRFEDYYTLYLCRTRGSAMFCSEPISGLNWVPLANGELVHAALEGEKLSVERSVPARTAQ